MTEQLVNYIPLTLASPALSSDTTLTLSAGASGLPSTGTFSLLLDQELVTVTSRSGVVVTVTRGEGGTTPAGHSSGVVVLPTVTARALAQLKADILAGSGTVFGVNGLRPTLTTGTPITTADVIGASTLFVTPMFSNQIALYTGGAWSVLSTPEISLALTITNGKNYDYFAYNNSGTVTLEQSAAWATDTTRTDALAQQDGVWVKAADHTRRFLGTLRATGTNTTEDSVLNRLLYSFYNQQPRKLLVQDSTTSWSYATEAWRQARGNGANQWTYVTGMPWEMLWAEVIACESNSSSAHNMSVGVGVDSTTVNSADLYGSGGQTAAGLPTKATYSGTPGIGFHTIAWLEWGSTGGQFYGNVNSLGSQIAGMSGRVMA